MSWDFADGGERRKEQVVPLGAPAQPARRNDPPPGTYIIIRVLPSYPHQVPDDLDGKWFDLASIPPWLLPGPAPTGAIAHETGRFVTREDGAEAQVWEIR